MKRFKINLGAVAVVMGIALAITGSAFTPADTQDIYVLTSSGYQLKSDVEDQGRCVTQQNQHCEFILNSSNEYEPAPGDVNRMWQEF